jgi:hypothetical protein
LELTGPPKAVRLSDQFYRALRRIEVNHLRELLESLPLSVGVDLKLSTGPGAVGLVNELAKLKLRGESAICFLLGDIDKILGIAPIPELCRLPYATCWFEAQVYDSRDKGWAATLGAFATQVGSTIDATVFYRGPGKQWSLEGAFQADPTRPHGTQVNWIGSEEALPEVRMVAAAVIAFLSALHCSNVLRREHTPDTKLQKARARRGKAPLFSYWTLELEGRSERSEDKGGTHASPRVHLVRGHPREYAAGKWTWVQAHARGNKANGMVHKDYSAGPALVPAAR